jgi:7-alpha-hydroxysteroid dehydrogenase
MTTDPFDLEDQTVEDLLQQNMLASLRLSQQVVKRMIKQSENQDEGQAGAIINISSIAARLTQAELMGFSVATAALDQMTRSFAVACAPHRIRVNAVAFGSVMSASLKQSLRDNEEFRDEIEDHTPLSRIAEPQELAETVRYLASEGSSFMTGQIVTLDGGRSLIDPVAAPVH